MSYATSERAHYMRHEITFAEYYGALVKLLGEDALRAMLPGGRTPAEWRALIVDDEHLNNVPLHQWDGLHGFVLMLVRQTRSDELKAISGTGGWSLSDSVCVLKTTARRYADEIGG